MSTGVWISCPLCGCEFATDEVANDLLAACEAAVERLSREPSPSRFDAQRLEEWRAAIKKAKEV